MRFLFIILLAIAAGAGCSSPCEELSKKRCDCEPTETEQRACKQQVDDEAAATPVTVEQEEICEGLLDQCTCEKLEAGELAACGLAVE